MRSLLFALIPLLFGFAAGTWYGYSSGMVDGAMMIELPLIQLVDRYAIMRSLPDTKPRDRLIDILTAGLATNFAQDRHLSPLAYFMKPKAELALLDVAASWELNQSLPLVWSDGKQPYLLPPGSKEAKRLDEAKSRLGGYYETLLEKKRKKRIEETAKLASDRQAQQ